MAERKAFLLRIDPALFEALQRWANDEVRSLNGQIEFMLTRAVRESGRLTGEGRTKTKSASGRRSGKEGGRAEEEG